MRTNRRLRTTLLRMRMKRAPPIVLFSLNMASPTQPCCAENHAVDEPFDSSESSASFKVSHLPEKEYDFVEEPSQDYLCPVTLELLRDPQQTTCCGHHLSLEAATRLQQGGKPCPMCKEPNLATMPDKFYKRKVNELKVRCPNKGSGCEWVGDFRSMDQHSNSCPKRPCQCDFCGFKGTYEVVTNDHSPVCVKYPEPCPNQCEIGTVPRCDMEKHLTQCPLQLVECEFAQAGCHERIPRQDLPRHMEEGAQRHLLSMSLFNLNLTRELHQKMDEKDRQIATLQEQNRELQQQGKQTEKQLSLVQEVIQQQGRMAADDLKQQVAMLQQKLEQQEKQSENLSGKTTVLLDKLDKKVVANGQKVAALQTRVEQQGERMKEQREQHRKEVREGVLSLVPKLEQQAVQLHDKTYQALSTFKEEVNTHLSVTLPLCHQDMVITEYESKRKQSFQYYSEPFYYQGYKFKLNVLQVSDGRISAYIYPLKGGNDDKLRWPIVCSGQLQLLNQLGDHDHHKENFQVLMNKDRRDSYYQIVHTFTRPGELGLNAQRHTQYLKDDSLHFKWSFTVIPK